MEMHDIAEPTPAAQQSRAHVLAFSSGKGGVGKTCITANIGVALARKGCRVCIFDADTGLANVSILLDLRPEYTLEHVLSGEKSLNEILIRTEDGPAIIPGASGIAECANLTVTQAKRLVDALTCLESEFDYILIDTAAGVSDSVLEFILSAQCAFIVITLEPTSLTDAFSLLKLLKARKYAGQLRVIVNMVADYPSGLKIYRRFAAAVGKYLGLNVEYGGFVVKDDLVLKSVRLQTPVVTLSENSMASRCLRALAENIMKHIGQGEPPSGFADYWKNVLAENAAPKSTETCVEPLPADRDTASASVPEIFRQLLLALKKRGTEREPVEAFLVQFISGFTEQFGDFPLVFRQLVYRWLESENHSAPRLVELVATLEALYAMHYQQPMFGLEEGVARLVAQTQGSQSKLRELVNQFRLVYRQTFHSDVFDAKEELLEAIRNGNFAEEQFEELQTALRGAYQAHSNRPYKGRSELLLESVTETLAAMASDEAELRAGIDALSQRSRQLAAQRSGRECASEFTERKHL